MNETQSSKNLTNLIKNNDIFKTFCIFAGFMSLLSIVPFNIQIFDSIVKYSVCIVAFWVLVVSFNAKEFISVIIFLVIAIVFNPFANFYLNTAIYKTSAFITSLLFFIIGYRLRVDANYRVITDEEADIIRNEYLKAEGIRKQAELERDKAKTEREIAEELRRKAQEEWERIKAKISTSTEDMKNPYQILGVHESDSLQTIKEIYRKLVTIYHPDKFGSINLLSKKQKNEHMAKINASYEWVLKHHKT